MILQSNLIRKKKYAVTDLNRIEQMMREAEICRLGFVDVGQAYIVPMNFGYDDGILYFHGGSTGKKMELLRKNPKVSFEMESRLNLNHYEEACRCDMQYACVMGTGIASEIKELATKKNALRVLMNQYQKKNWTFPDELVVKTSIIQVRIETLSAKSNIEEYIS